jgi:hypothetical protein
MKLIDRSLAHLFNKTLFFLANNAFPGYSRAVVKPAKAFLRWHLSLLICAFFQATNWQIDSFVRHFLLFSLLFNKSRAHPPPAKRRESLQMTRHILAQSFEFIAIQYLCYKHLRTLDCSNFFKG